MQLSNKVVVVTGGGRGLGRALSDYLDHGVRCLSFISA